jgi:hypothetical protein
VRTVNDTRPAAAITREGNMEAVQMILTMAETGPGLVAGMAAAPPSPPVAAQPTPVVYAAGWARCPRCRIEYPYDAILYPWCPGCCDRPGEPADGSPR